MARTAESIAQQVIELRLVDPQDLQEVWSEVGRAAPADELLQALVRHNLLTNWQVGRLKKDYSVGFYYGDYRLLYLAGSGTFARVYRAIHRTTGEIVAVKVLRSRHADSDDVVEHFVREGQVGKKLRHPNIVAIYDYGKQDHTHYIVMEFVEGNNLKEFVRIRKRLEPLEATHVLMEITSAIKYANQQGFSHRDMKMTNVLVSTAGQAKLIDFGLAAKKGEEVPRTVDYAGLEKAGGGPKDDPRSDLYFVGCLYYHMLAGEPPLKETRNKAERGARGRFLNVVPIQHLGQQIPRFIGEIVDRAMHINPEIRYQSPSQLLIDLKRAIEKLSQAGDKTTDAAQDEGPVHTGPRRPVMIVEADPQSQELFRDGLRRSGYRVLIVSDPFRALDRIAQEPAVAECVVFSAEAIGRDALEAFNRFADDEKTKNIPAVLLLGIDQREWRHEAHLGPHRVFMSMPIKLKALRSVLARLMNSEVVEDTEEEQPSA
jgi:serine/threonine-protein kinase